MVILKQDDFSANHPADLGAVVMITQHAMPPH